MNIKITKTSNIQAELPVIYIVSEEDELKNFSFSSAEFAYIKKQAADKKKPISINSYSKWSYIQWVDLKKEKNSVKEKMRRAAGSLYPIIKENKHEKILVIDLCNDDELTIAFAEGLALSHYQFLKYFSKSDEKKNHLKEINIHSQKVSDSQIYNLNVLIDSVYKTRNLVNEPVSYLNAEKFAEEIQKMGEEAHFNVEVFNKKKIELLKMNGLLAVNKGSIDPPTFSVLTWKPDNAINKNPYILVGKGIVYDTGGLSLKPSNYMDTMKSDMAGGAAVAGTIYAIAKTKLPIYIVGLVPSTDNRPNGNAYVPDDVIEMHSGTTVEVKNTDAEGRLVLADALSFAKKYNPELVIDLATLTGSAHAAVGDLGIVAMSNIKDNKFDKLKMSGENVYERIVEFPLWEEYDEMLKSDIADIKNIGGKEAGAITAAKFLEHFIDYPWAHFDIAGSAFLTKHDNYRGSGATGVAVRLLFDFFNKQL